MRRWLIQAPAVLPWTLVAAAVLAATAFAFLQTDDFCTFGRVAIRFKGNPLAELANLYQHWTGRYTASLLVALVASSSLLAPVQFAYPLALVMLMTLFGWACLEVSRLLGGRDGRPNLAWMLVAFAATMIMMPSKLEQYLWLTGAAVYFAGASLLLILVRTLVLAPARPSPAQNVWLCVLVVLITGFNEFLAVATGACLALSMLQARLQHHALRPHFVRLGVFGLAFAVAVLAPGNFARDAASAATRHQLGDSASQALADFSGFLSAFASTNLAVFFTGMAGAFAAGMLGGSNGIARRRWQPWILLLLAAFPLHLWMYTFLTGEATPGRVVNQAFTLANVALCLAAAACGQAVSGKWPAFWRRASLPVLGVAGVGFIATQPFIAFAGAVHGFGPIWQSQQLQRHAGLTGIQPSKQPVYVRPFEGNDASPPIYRGADVGPDPAHWINRCVADYYRIPAIIQMRRTHY